MTWAELAEKQATVVQMLKNSILKERLAHAYLFEGKQGTKTDLMAFQLAKAFLCQKRGDDAEPCHTCEHCRRIDSGNHPDLHLIQAEGASIKVDQIRHLLKEFSYQGLESTRKVYIVEEADTMTNSAANSLLKFLEEPGGESLAILQTTKRHAILPTIQSRVQVLSFAPLPPESVIETLLEKGYSEVQARIASQIAADVEEAESLCSSDWIAQARSKVIQLVHEISKRPQRALLTVHEHWLPFFSERSSLQLGMDMLMLWYRDLLRVQIGQENQVVYTDCMDDLKNQALSQSQPTIRHKLTAIFDAKRRLDANSSPQLVMDQLLLKLQEG
ncbi:DNA polymerase III subunit delta' [Texcoconibacillus texcoconensis]|uniref:DNA polymerase III subunit delta' n=1 Tax=Texcoconibacillus texcoconensis TaxID=1095777 RepID=A0A840QTP9_9BACI|nr:DNA polymerase III subunit delta' [Texcoconibacillus texcoconensis]MBB5174926.1 DNA polymerase-3 subunit delta' [Texcoconibacillus texcoconensis]